MEHDNLIMKAVFVHILLNSFLNLLIQNWNVKRLSCCTIKWGLQGYIIQSLAIVWLLQIMSASALHQNSWLLYLYRKGYICIAYKGNSQSHCWWIEFIILLHLWWWYINWGPWMLRGLRNKSSNSVTLPTL